MLLTSTPALIFTSASLGVISHLTYFIQSDHPFYHVTTIFYCLIFSPFALLLLFVAGAKYSVLEALFAVFISQSSFVAAIWLSMLIYRAFFHRLRHYPGPFAARLSQFWRSWRHASKQSYLVLDEMHKTYGDYVRVGTLQRRYIILDIPQVARVYTGPREISIIDPAAIEPVLGPKSTCGKSIWYDYDLPMTSLHQTRDRNVHAQRRRGVWDPAFNTACE